MNLSGMVFQQCQENDHAEERDIHQNDDVRFLHKFRSDNTSKAYGAGSVGSKQL